MSMEFKHPIGSILDDHEDKPSKPEGLLPATPTAKVKAVSPLKDNALRIYWVVRDLVEELTR